MQKRVFIVHGWGGNPEEGWLPWLKKELSAKGFEVHVPAMPDTENPKIETWIPYLAKVVGNPDENTYFVGHSIGCQTILRYLDSLPENKKVGGVVCVAGFFRLLHLATKEEKTIAKSWLETAMDYDKIKQNAKKIVAIFSDNDPDVDLGDKELFKKYLNAKTIIEHDKGHFSEDAGVKELPSALDAVLEMSSA